MEKGIAYYWLCAAFTFVNAMVLLWAIPSLIMMQSNYALFGVMILAVLLMTADYYIITKYFSPREQEDEDDSQDLDG